MKYLRICSDLHLEFYRSNNSKDVINELIPEDNRDASSGLVLAGDISSNWEQLTETFDQLVGRFSTIFYIPGNHEFYNRNLIDWDEFWLMCSDRYDADKLQMSTHLNPIQAVVGDTNIFGITLWSSCGQGNPIHERSVGSMNDFYRIRLREKNITVPDIQKLHSDQVYLLKSSLNQYPKEIVITHHLPSFALCDPRYSPSNNDGLFASNLDELLSQENSPRLWICGHTHHHIERQLGNTQFVVNPSGYPGERDTGYNPKLFVEI